MTDIFARKPAKTPNVPALRYELFIKKIEIEVVAAQARIKALEQMEQVYNIVRDALEACRFPNDTKLDLATTLVAAEIKAVPTDRLAGFNPLIETIGKGLLRAGLHRDGEPSVGAGYSGPVRRFQWALTGKSYRIVSVNIELPEVGLPDCRVVKVPRTYTIDEYRLEPVGEAASAINRNLHPHEEIAF